MKSLLRKLVMSSRPVITTEEIHNQIDTAEERIKLQLEEILQKANGVKERQIISKAEKLKKLGFINSETLKQGEELKKTGALSKEQLTKFNYYKQKYPFEKILTVTELERIMVKYNLISAHANFYKLDIPEKNVNEMFNIRPTDEADILETTYELVGLEDDSLIRYLGKEKPIFTKKEADDLCIKYYGRLPDGWSISEGEVMWLLAVSRTIRGVPLSSAREYRYKKVNIINNEGIFIAAPLSHFDLKELIKNGLNYENVKKMDVKDPIAFIKLKDDFVRIISKWGTDDDQSYLDPTLTNEIEN